VEPRAVWVLNLDAEFELGCRGSWTPSAALTAFVEAHRERAAACVPADERVLRRGEVLPPEQRGLPGRAWCMTPSARAALEAAGARPEPAPDVGVLRRVHHRAFALGLGEPLPGEAFAATWGELEAALQGLGASELGGQVLAKRAWSTAGRGQRRLRARELGADDRRWLERSLEAGGVQLEPLVAIALETVVHGRVAESGDVALAPLAVQEVGPGGAWLRTRALRPGELDAAELASFEDGARAAGTALACAGYFGAFGVDGFVWTPPGGGRRLRTVGELNPRFTMGWTEPVR